MDTLNSAKAASRADLAADKTTQQQRPAEQNAEAKKIETVPAQRVEAASEAPSEVAGTESADSAPAESSNVAAEAQIREQALRELEEDPEGAASALQEKFHEFGTSDLDITYDRDSSRFVIRLLDPDTGEVRREIPPERLLDLNKKLEKMRGLLVDEKS